MWENLKSEYVFTLEGHEVDVAGGLSSSWRTAMRTLTNAMLPAARSFLTGARVAASSEAIATFEGLVGGSRYVSNPSSEFNPVDSAYRSAAQALHSERLSVEEELSRLGIVLPSGVDVLSFSPAQLAGMVRA